MTHCSVSDFFIVYSVVEENENFSLRNAAEDSEIASNTLIVVIDVKNKTEIVLRNPSSSQITAVYADEKLLLLGSLTKIFQLTPSKLFLSESGSSFEPHASTFKEITLPADYLQNHEIYAFWHTKNQVKVDVFVKSTIKAEIALFHFHTTEAIEKLRMSQSRRSVRQL